MMCSIFLHANSPTIIEQGVDHLILFLHFGWVRKLDTVVMSKSGRKFVEHPKTCHHSFCESSLTRISFREIEVNFKNKNPRSFSYVPVQSMLLPRLLSTDTGHNLAIGE